MISSPSSTKAIGPPTAFVEDGDEIVVDLNSNELNCPALDDAQLLAGRIGNIEPQDIADMQLVTRYGPGYDFRNKRLPVWQVTVADADKTRLFVDPATGVLVDQSRGIDRAERLSFSLLHKWSHLTPLTGRQGRDLLIVFTLLLLLVSSAIGGTMLVKRKKRGAKAQPQPAAAGSIGAVATQ